MSKEKRRVPKLRFPGFTEDWEQRKLATLYKRVNERNDGTLGRDKWISVAKMYFQDPDKVQSNNLDTRTYVMKIGDIAFEGHPNNEFKFGRFVLNDIGTGIISELFPIYRPITEYDIDFWKYAIQLERIMGPIFAKSITSSGNSSNKLDHNHFLNQELLVPNIDEQKQIGSLLSLVTKIITLHQRKLDNLKLKKKALLQKLFPKNGERYPELRFPGFTDAWEQRKLGEYANFRRGSFPQPYGNKEWYDGVGSAPFVQVVDVGDNLSLVDCTKQRISKLAQPMSVYAEKGSVLVTLQGSIGRVAVSQYDAFIDRTILIFQGYKYKTNSYFWAYIIKNKFSEEALKAPGGTIKTITKEALSNFIILYPKFSEQEQIGSFFEKLDKLITLHQRKLDHLQLQKKALLQQMFV